MDNGLWIKIYVSLFTHEKTLHMAELLNMNPLYAATHLIALWLWAMSNRQEGDLNRMTDKQIALAARYDGDEKKFIAALKTARFLDDDLKIHNWTSYAGKFLSKKKEHAEYMEKWRKMDPIERARRSNAKIRSSKSATPEEKKKSILALINSRNEAQKSNGIHKKIV